MKIIGPTTPSFKPVDDHPVAKAQSAVAHGRRDFGFTNFCGKLGPRTEAVLAAQPPVTEESNKSLATALIKV